MTKSLLKKAAFACTLSILTAIFIASCKSAPVTDNTESTVTEQKPETTYVNTAPDRDGKIFTVCIFTDITEVTAIDIDNHENKVAIPLNKCKYNSETTELSIDIPKANMPKGNFAFHIVGVPVFPARFILHAHDDKSGKPAVFIEGKEASEGADYTFDNKTKELAFIKEIDADKTSYLLSWRIKDGFNTIGNKTDDFKSAYDLLLGKWASAKQR